MPKTKWRWNNRTTNKRTKYHKPVWLFKWTASGAKVGKQKKLNFQKGIID